MLAIRFEEHVRREHMRLANRVIGRIIEPWKERCNHTNPGHPANINGLHDGRTAEAATAVATATMSPAANLRPHRVPEIAQPSANLVPQMTDMSQHNAIPAATDPSLPQSTVATDGNAAADAMNDPNSVYGITTENPREMVNWASLLNFDYQNNVATTQGSATLSPDVGQQIVTGSLQNDGMDSLPWDSDEWNIGGFNLMQSGN